MIVRRYTFFFTGGFLSFNPFKIVYVYGWSVLNSCLRYYEVGKAACFKWDFSVSHGRNKLFYWLVILNVEHKVVFHADVRHGNRNFHLTVRLNLLAVFRNVDVKNIYVALLIVVLIGNCLKNCCRFFCGRFDFVAYQGRAFFKATSVNNDTVFVFERLERVASFITCRKGKCKNGS